MMAVKFVKGMSPYQAGEIAGFPEEEARRLIQAGVAEEYAVKKSPEKPQVDKMVNAAPNKSSVKLPVRTRRK